jgi:hypothetical protein
VDWPIGWLRARIRDIQAQLARDAGTGADTEALIGKLEVVYRRAIGDHHFTAAARAIELQARLARMAAAPRSSRPALFPAPAMIEGVGLPQCEDRAEQKRADAKASNYNEPGK